ncbi:GIN domain-containing protein [Flagellimonas sp.]|uniref:GIN domain-containing protein n=1 Tax=Flagellimonas sp. TaxID=2058762 RepID=UPI003F49C7B3
MRLTKTNWIWGVALLAASCSTETVRVSDEVSIRTYDFNEITALEVATDFTAYVSFSDAEQSIRIEANSNLFEKIDVFEQNGKLTVKVKNNVNIKGRETLNLFINARSIIEFRASSDASIILGSPLNASSASIRLSSDANFDGDVTADDFELTASSDSRAILYLNAKKANMDFSSGAQLDGEVVVDEANVKLSSDSEINVMGAIADLTATLSSDSKIKDYALGVEVLKVTLSSDSEAYLTVSNTIDVTANSDSRFFYKGDAEIIRQNLSSNGQVIKK